MTDHASKNPIDVEKYNHVIESVYLSDIRLVSSRFDVKPQYYAAIAQAEESDATSVSRSFECKINADVNDADSAIVGFVDWDLKVKSDRKSLLRIQAKYLIIFSLRSQVDSECAQVFVTRVGQTSTYPFFRSLTSVISGDSRADLPVLPLIKTDALSKYESKSEH